MNIDPNNIKNIISTSIQSVTGSAELPERNQSLEQAGVNDKPSEIQFKQTLIDQTLDYLSNSNEVNLDDSELVQLGSELHTGLTFSRRQSVGSFEDLFSETLMQALPGDSTNEKDPDR